MHHPWLVLSGVMFAMLLVPASSRCENFRVDTDVYLEGERQPVAQTLTIFFGDVVYDILYDMESKEPKEITVYDGSRARVIMLDIKSERQTVISTTELLNYSAGLKARIASRNGQGFNTRFEQQAAEDPLKIVLTGKQLTYRANGLRPKDPSAVHRYREFADWHARLNAIRPGNPPPFGRLMLNQLLADKELVPEQIHRTLVVAQTLLDAKSQVRSQHTFTWLLSGSDRSRIERAGNYMSTFRSVSLAEYFRPAAATRP